MLDPASYQLPSLLMTISKAKASALGYNYGPQGNKENTKKEHQEGVGGGVSLGQSTRWLCPDAWGSATRQNSLFPLQDLGPEDCSQQSKKLTQEGLNPVQPWPLA